MTGFFRVHRQAIVPVAGLFVFLPLLAGLLFVPAPEFGSDPQEAVQKLTHWLEGHWPALIGQMIVMTYGAIVIYRIVLVTPTITLGQGLVEAVHLLPLIIAANFLSTMAISLGLRLFIVPGLYIAGRLIAVAPALVALKGQSPLEAARRAWAATHGNGWRLILMMLVLGTVIFVVSLVLAVVLGILVQSIVPGATGIVTALIQAAMASMLSVVGVLLAAAAYRLGDRRR